MGATTALNLAAEQPDRLRTLVVIGISPDREPRARVARHALDPERIERDDPAWARRLDRAPRSGPGAGRVAPAAAGDRRRRRRPAAADAAAIHADRRRRRWSPAATATRSSRSAQAWALARELPHARLLVAPDCGHELIRRSGPRSCAAALDDFYRRGARPMTTLLVLYRRPDGGAEALAEFERRYAAEHLPLVAATPGLRATRVQRVVGRSAAETDLVLVTAMRVRRPREPRRRPRLGRDARGRAEPARDRARPGDVPRARGCAGTGRGGFRRVVDTVTTPSRGSRVTDDPAEPRSAPRRHVARRVPRARPGVGGARRPRSTGVALVTIDRPRGAQRAQLRPARRARRRPRGARRATRPAARSC